MLAIWLIKGWLIVGSSTNSFKCGCNSRQVGSWQSWYHSPTCIDLILKKGSSRVLQINIETFVHFFKRLCEFRKLLLYLPSFYILIPIGIWPSHLLSADGRYQKKRGQSSNSNCRSDSTRAGQRQRQEKGKGQRESNTGQGWGLGGGWAKKSDPLPTPRSCWGWGWAIVWGRYRTSGDNTVCEWRQFPCVVWDNSTCTSIFLWVDCHLSHTPYAN